jgi:parallel beta-helix repeat protein
MVRALSVAALMTVAWLAPLHSASAVSSVLYVGGPGCSDSGPGTESQPFCTISAASSAAVAGQTVQVSSGVYQEAVTVARSGTSTAPIVFTTAPGASVTVRGGSFGFKTSSRSWVTIIGFTITQVSTYGIQVSSSSNITVEGVTVSQTGSHGVYVAGSTAVTVDAATVSNTTGNGIHVTGASSSVAVDGATVSGATGNGVHVAGSTAVTVDGAMVSNATGNGVYVTDSSSVTVRDSHTSYAGQPVSGSTKKGIYLYNTTGSLVVGNTSDHNSDAGIYLTNGSTGNEVRGNITFANARVYTRAAPGIDIRSSGNTVARNVSYGNEDSGIQFYNGGGDSLIFENVTYGNGDHGIDNLNSTNQVIVANTVYGNTTSGINVEGTPGTSASQGARLANNISVDNALNSFATKGNIRVDANSITGTTIDYDLVYLSSAGKMFTWGNTTYTSLSAFTAATGQESHGLQAIPGFANPASGDLHILAGSPAIDSADSGAPGQPATDIDGNPRADDPATPNTGVGPRTYDDRGAYEFQP